MTHDMRVEPDMSSPGGASSLPILLSLPTSTLPEMRWRDMIGLAQLTEGAGFASVIVPDHVVTGSHTDRYLDGVERAVFGDFTVAPTPVGGARPQRAQEHRHRSPTRLGTRRGAAQVRRMPPVVLRRLQITELLGGICTRRRSEKSDRKIVRA